MEFLLGKPVADKIKSSLLEKISILERKPKLVILLNVEDLSSKGYCNALIKTAASMNIDCEVVEMVQKEDIYLNKIEENKDSEEKTESEKF